MDGSVTWGPPDVPNQCPRCGWTPVFVTIEIVDDWRSVGRPGR
jgi:hypothetical protein